MSLPPPKTHATSPTSPPAAQGSVIITSGRVSQIRESNKKRESPEDGMQDIMMIVSSKSTDLWQERPEWFRMLTLSDVTVD